MVLNPSLVDLDNQHRAKSNQTPEMAIKDSLTRLSKTPPNNQVNIRMLKKESSLPAMKDQRKDSITSLTSDMKRKEKTLAVSENVSYYSSRNGQQKSATLIAVSSTSSGSSSGGGSRTPSKKDDRIPKMSTGSRKLIGYTVLPNKQSVQLTHQQQQLNYVAKKILFTHSNSKFEDDDDEDEEYEIVYDSNNPKLMDEQMIITATSSSSSTSSTLGATGKNSSYYM
jgi:hypothetical protein